MFESFPPLKPETTLRMIGWWELRRLIYNALILVAFFATYFGVCVVVGPHLAPGEDPIEPMAVIFVIVPTYFAVANICYTFCWVIPAVLRSLHVRPFNLARDKGFWVFLFLSCLITSVPFWYMLAFWFGKPAVPQ
jgi:hypothetical protein